MLKRIILALVAALVLVLLVAAIVTAQEATGSLSGQVVNGTAGASAASPLTVTLYSFEGETARDPVQTLTDDLGRFRFDGLPLTETMQYAVTTGYLSVTYASELYTFAAGSPVITASLPVYETTENDEGIAFDRLHIIIEPSDEGYVAVQEIYVVNNPSDRTYIGIDPTGGHVRITGRYSIPLDATDVTLEDGGLDRFVAIADGFVDTFPVTPGQGTSQVIVEYRLPYTRDRLSVSHPLGFPADGVQWFLLGDELDVTGDEITFQRTMGSAAQTYRVYYGPAVARGGSVTYDITGLEPSGGQAFPTGLVLVIAGGLVILVTAAIGIPLLRGQRAASEAAELAQSANAPTSSRRQALVDEIATLDDDHEAGRIADSNYATRRGALMSELIELTRAGDAQKHER